MSVLSERLAANKAKSQPIMHSVPGAVWQESAIARIDCTTKGQSNSKGSEAHLAIGRLVTAINNGLITPECADREFVNLLSK